MAARSRYAQHLGNLRPVLCMLPFICCAVNIKTTRCYTHETALCSRLLFAMADMLVDEAKPPPALPPEPPGIVVFLTGLQFLIWGGFGYWQAVEWTPCIKRKGCTPGGWWPLRNLPLIIILGIQVLIRLAFIMCLMSTGDCIDIEDPDDESGDTETGQPRLPRTPYGYIREPLNQIAGIGYELAACVGVFSLSAWLGGVKPLNTYFWLAVVCAIIYLLCQALAFLATLMDGHEGNIMHWAHVLYHGLPRIRIDVWIGQWVVLVMYVVHFATCSSPSATEASSDTDGGTEFCSILLLRMWLLITVLIMEGIYTLYAIIYAAIVITNKKANGENNVVYMPAFGSLGQWTWMFSWKYKATTLLRMLVVATLLVFVPTIYVARPHPWQIEGVIALMYIFTSLAVVWGLVHIFSTKEQNIRYREDMDKEPLRGDTRRRSRAPTGYGGELLDYVRSRQVHGRKLYMYIRDGGGHRLTYRYFPAEITPNEIRAAESVQEAIRNTEPVEYDAEGNPKPKIKGTKTHRQDATAVDQKHPPILQAPPAAPAGVPGPVADDQGISLIDIQDTSPP